MAHKSVVLATIGSYGDLHPYMAAALALKRRGVRPVIATTDFYRDKIAAEGIDFHAVRPGHDQLYRDTGLTQAEFVAVVLRSPVQYLIETMMMPYLDEACADLMPIVKAADLVIVSSFSLAAAMAAEASGRPVISAPLSPIALLSDLDPPAFAELPSLPVLSRLFGPGVARLVFDLGRTKLKDVSRRINEARATVGLPPAMGNAMLDHPYQADEVVALFSPLFGSAPSVAPKPTTVAGFAFFDRDGQQQVSEEIEAFMSCGDPPVVFTLGSIAVLGGERFYEHAAQAARRMGRRALLLVGREAEGALRARLGAADILVAGYAPHSTVFPRAAAIVHHGGVGTTAQALRAGRPQLVCPIFGDQPDNAYRVRRLGVGQTLAFTRVSATRLAAKLRAVLRDAKLGERAQVVASQIGLEDGAEVMADRVVARLNA